MKTFALLLPHAPDRYSDLDDAAMADIIKDYVAWVEQLTRDGVYAGGHKLTDAPGKTLVKGADGIAVHDSPSPELAEILGGIMLIKATDFDEAVRIARTNPHMVHNQRIEIREVHDMD